MFIICKQDWYLSATAVVIIRNTKIYDFCRLLCACVCTYRSSYWFPLSAKSTGSTGRRHSSRRRRRRRNPQGWLAVT